MKHFSNRTSPPQPAFVRLQLHAVVYNLGNFLRTLATPEPIQDWSLTSPEEKLIKIGAKVVSHGRHVAFQIAEIAISRHLFADILRLITELRPEPPPTPSRRVRMSWRTSENHGRGASWRGPNWSFRRATCRFTEPGAGGRSRRGFALVKSRPLTAISVRQSGHGADVHSGLDEKPDKGRFYDSLSMSGEHRLTFRGRVPT